MTTTTRNGTAKTRRATALVSGADSERLGTGVTKPTHREIVRQKNESFKEKAEKPTMPKDSRKKSDDENIPERGGGDPLPTSFYAQ